jgi:hypothetical protein
VPRNLGAAQRTRAVRRQRRSHPGQHPHTADRVALIDWDESRVDVPDFDLVLPHDAAGLDDDAHDVPAQAWAAWDAALCYTSGYHEFAAERLAEVSAP